MFQFTETSYSVSEGDGIVQFAVELIDKVLTFDLDVLVYDISGGSATGKDIMREHEQYRSCINHQQDQIDSNIIHN